MHHALIKHIELKEKRWSCISSAYFQKEKEFTLREKNPYITACSLNVGAYKEFKTCYINQNLTFHIFPEQMIEWKVACL